MYPIFNNSNGKMGIMATGCVHTVAAMANNKTFIINKHTKTFVNIQNFVLHAGDYDFGYKTLSIRESLTYLYWSSGTLVIITR